MILYNSDDWHLDSWEYLCSGIVGVLWGGGACPPSLPRFSPSGKHKGRSTVEKDCNSDDHVRCHGSRSSGTSGLRWRVYHRQGTARAESERHDLDLRTCGLWRMECQTGQPRTQIEIGRASCRE